MRKAIALFGLLLLVACETDNAVPGEPAFIGPLQTELAEAQAADEAAFATEMATTPTATPVPLPTIVPTATPIPWNRYTMVLLGGDFDPLRPERVRFGVRSDVFVIVVVDYEVGTDKMIEITLVNVPRDLWLEVPCSPLDPELEGYDRVNAAWAYGEFECVKKTVEVNFPFAVNGPIAYLEFDGFLNIADHFGGLIITPTEYYRDWCGVYHGTDGAHGNYVEWFEGQPYNMDSDELLCYIRGRQGASDGDIDRTRRAQEVLRSMVEQWPSLMFDTRHPTDMISDAFALMELFQKDIIVDGIMFEHFTNLIPLINRDKTWSTVRFTLDQVDFWRTPIYNASVLKPKVDIYDYVDCMVGGIGDVEYISPEVCTEQTLLEPDV